MFILICVLIVFLFVALYSDSSYFISNYTIIIPLLYICLNIMYIRKFRKWNILNFEFFFSLSYFLCCFLTHIVISSIDSYKARIFLETPDTQYRTYVICMVGYLFYMLGLIYKREGNKYFSSSDIFVGKSLVQISNWICLMFILIFFIEGGKSLLTIYSSQAVKTNRLEGWGGYLMYSMITYTISILTNLLYIKQTSKSLLSLPKIFLLNSSILFIMLGLSGYRSNLIQLVLPLVYVYNQYYSKISNWKIIVFFVLGVCFLAYSGLTRSGDMIDRNSLDVFVLVRDFVPANAANIYLIDYADKYGYTYGSNWIMQILSVIPFAQNIYLSLFGRADFAPYSSIFFTAEMESFNSGLGTGLVGDIYYSTGIVGVCFFMFLLGFACNKLSNSKSSIIVTVMLLVFFGNSVFACRVEYFYIVRMISFAAIIMWMEVKISKYRTDLL